MKLAVVALLVQVVAALGGAPAPQGVDVVRVVDGDTVVLRDVGSVRLIGVDTPETQDPREPVQHFGVEAAAFLRELLDGQAVRLDYDQQRLDKYRRTLAYLYLPDGTFVNREIIRQGYGHAYLTYPFKYADDFRAAEREAREAERGLWGALTPVAALEQSTATQVWVNMASRVYHCPGTRYYGKTARGEMMAEADATNRGYRPAYGRPCSPATSPTAPTSTAPVAPLATASPPSPAPQTVRVWVNTSSRVYHCPGTRYYGNTARGEYLSEGEAETKGHRPAGGRRCGPPAASPSVPAVQPLATAPRPPATADVRVWVNTSSRVYHCPGTRYYGATKAGVYMEQTEAQSKGYRPAGGTSCR